MKNQRNFMKLATSLGAAGPAPAFPGEDCTFTFTAVPGDRLSLATMLVQGNDLSYAPAETGLALFDAAGVASSGDMTGMFLFWDAGTETSEFLIPNARRNPEGGAQGPPLGDSMCP